MAIFGPPGDIWNSWGLFGTPGGCLWGYLELLGIFVTPGGCLWGYLEFLWIFGTPGAICVGIFGTPGGYLCEDIWNSWGLFVWGYLELLGAICVGIFGTPGGCV